MVSHNNSIEQNKKEHKNATKKGAPAAGGNPKLEHPDRPST